MDNPIIRFVGNHHLINSLNPIKGTAKWNKDHWNREFGIPNTVGSYILIRDPSKEPDDRARLLSFEVVKNEFIPSENKVIVTLSLVGYGPSTPLPSSNG